ncbi:T9SS type A sorting domain-containing protein [bacterium]|nr:T9SS type A sorting domain-containing protein [bacterium]
MKKSYLLLVGTFFLLINIIQAQRFDWLETYGVRFSNSTSSTKVYENNVYVASTFISTISIGPTTLNTQNSHTRSIYISNYDTLGNFRWAIKGGSNSNSESFIDMELDRWGNIYIAGSFINTTTWGGLTLNTSGGGDGTPGVVSEAFIVKLNPQGVAQWIQGVYGPGTNYHINYISDISVVDSSVYFYGPLNRTIEVTNSTKTLIQPIGTSQENFYVARWDLNGNLNLLSKVLQQAYYTNSFPGKITGKNDSTYLITARLRNVYYLGSNNLLANGDYYNHELYIIEYTNHYCNWFKSTTSLYTSSSALGGDIELGNNGDIYIAGTFHQTFRLENQTINADLNHINLFVAKLNSRGNLIHLKQYPVKLFRLPKMKYTANDELVLIGEFEDSLEINNIKTFSNGSKDIIVANLDTALNFNWYQTGGGVYDDYGVSISNDRGSNIYVLGTYNSLGLSHFGTTYLNGSNNTYTAILSKMSECVKTQIPFTFNADTNLCQGQSVNIQATPVAGSTFQWLKDSSLLVSQTNNNLTVNSKGYYQVITNLAGCTDTSRGVRVQVGTPPTVSLTLSDTVCEINNPFSLSGGFPIGGIYKGPGILNNIFDPSSTGVGHKTITYIYSNQGCRDSASVVIYVKPAPTVFFAPPANICISSPPFTLTNATPNGGSYTGNGVSDGVFNPLLAGVGNHVITYTYSDSIGCSSSFTQTIQVDTIETVTLASLPTFCIDDGAYVLNEGSPSNGIYQGTGIVNGVFYPSISGIGTFLVRYVFNNECIKDTVSSIITVKPKPTVTLSSFSPVCKGTSMITLSGGLPTNGVYSGVGVINGQFNPTSEGTYKIYYDYTDSLGCSSKDSSNLVVNPLPSITLTNDTTICAGTSITLTVSGGNSYTWSNLATTSSITVSPATTTKYYVTSINSNACQKIDSVTVSVTPNPTASIGGDFFICEGSSTTLTASGGVRYAWSNSINTVTNSVSPLISSSYTVTVTNSLGCTSTASQLVTVNPKPIVTLASFPAVCEEDSIITLSGGSPSNGTYSGVGVINGQFNPTNSGTYKIYYNYIDGLGCSSSDSSSLIVNSLPTIGLTNDTTICAGDSITLTASGGTTYIWSNSATTSSITTAPTSTTMYYVSISNGNACSRMDSVVVTVSQIPTLTVSNDSSICLGDTIVLMASSNFTNYSWNTNETTSSIQVHPPKTQWYIVKSYNGTSCFAIDSTLVTVNIGTPLNIGPDTTLNSTFTSYVYDAGAGYLTYLWFDNSTSQTKNINYNPLKAGKTDTISVIAYNYIGCPSLDTAKVFYDFNTLINNSDISEFEWEIYPNPTTGLVNLQFSNEFTSTKLIEVFDLNGKLILSKLLLTNEYVTKLNLAENKLEIGLYTIRVTSNLKVLYKKLVITY